MPIPSKQLIQISQINLEIIIISYALSHTWSHLGETVFLGWKQPVARDSVILSSPLWIVLPGQPYPTTAPATGQLNSSAPFPPSLLPFLPALTSLEDSCFCVCFSSITVGISAAGSMCFTCHCALPKCGRCSINVLYIWIGGGWKKN